MKRTILLKTNFVPSLCVVKDLGAMFTYLTLGKNGARYYSIRRSFNSEMGGIYINFIKALVHNKLNLKFNTQKEIINFLENYKGDKLFTQSYISALKRRGGEFEKVTLTPQSEDFLKYVKTQFPEFNDSDFILGGKTGKTVKGKTTSKDSKKKPVVVGKATKIKKKPAVGKASKTHATKRLNKRIRGNKAILSVLFYNMIQSITKVVKLKA